VNKSTMIGLIVVVGIAIVGAAGYFFHHMATGQM
jgi:flagellar basal body-associated protein FliL